MLGQLTSVARRAVLSITLVNVALVVSPVVPASGNIKSHSHQVEDWSLNNFKLLRLHIQQPD